MFGIEINEIQVEKLFNAERAWANLPFILEGVPLTLFVAVIGMAIGLILGFFLALARGSSHIWLRWPGEVLHFLHERNADSCLFVCSLLRASCRRVETAGHDGSDHRFWNEQRCLYC